jgi:UvrD-like helicase C-terminal domain
MRTMKQSSERSWARSVIAAGVEAASPRCSQTTRHGPSLPGPRRRATTAPAARYRYGRSTICAPRSGKPSAKPHPTRPSPSSQSPDAAEALAPLIDVPDVAVVPASLVKGLEYDQVIVVEPADIVAAEPRGLNRLYVALTRAVASLVVLHRKTLPDALNPVGSVEAVADKS